MRHQSKQQDSLMRQQAPREGSFQVLKKALGKLNLAKVIPSSVAVCYQAQNGLTLGRTFWTHSRQGHQLQSDDGMDQREVTMSAVYSLDMLPAICWMKSAQEPSPCRCRLPS